MNIVKILNYYLSIMFNKTTKFGAYDTIIFNHTVYINKDYTTQEDIIGFVNPHNYNFKNSEAAEL